MKALPLLLISLLFLHACKKDPDKIGADIIPESAKPGLAYTDSITISAHSILVDSVRTDATTHNLFGSMTDPVFGRTDASFYTQFRLSLVNPDFGENPVLDSMILTLEYAGYYGDTLTPQTMRVYEIADQLYLDSVYYSESYISDYGFDYADYTFTPGPAKIEVGEDTLKSQVFRLDLTRISNELGNKILAADSNTLSNNVFFTEYFKGLYFKPDPVYADGSISYFDLLADTSRLTLYYHDADTSHSYDLLINDISVRVNDFKHDYNMASQGFIDQVINEDTSLGREILYLQSMGGVRSKLRFPHLREMNDMGNILVNEARLIIPVETADPLYRVPGELGLLRNLDDGGLEFIVDEIQTPGIFGGTYDSIAGSYSFRITRYMQKLLLGDMEDHGISLYIKGPATNAYRLIMQGTEADNQQGGQESMRLELRYTMP